jgi:hypothetical protein
MAQNSDVEKNTTHEIEETTHGTKMKKRTRSGKGKSSRNAMP